MVPPPGIKTIKIESVCRLMKFMRIEAS